MVKRNEIHRFLTDRTGLSLFPGFSTDPGRNGPFWLNRYRRKRPKVDTSIFDSALSHTRRSDASEKREKNSVSTFGRFRLWTSFESSPVSVKFSTGSILSAKIFISKYLI